MRIHSYEKEFRLQFHFHASQSHFHKKGSALRLALKQRHKGPRKCPIVTTSELLNNIVIQLIICWLRIHGIIVRPQGRVQDFSYGGYTTKEGRD